MLFTLSFWFCEKLQILNALFSITFLILLCHFFPTQFYLDIINIQNWCFWLYGSQQTVEKRWEYQTTWPASWETCMQVEKQQLELDMEQQTGSKSGKENAKAVYCHPAYLTYMQSTSWEMLAEWSTSSIKIAGRNIKNLRYTDGTTLMAESEEELKSPLMKLKEGSEKSRLKLNIKKLSSWHPVPLLHGKKRGESENSDRFYFLGLQNHCGQWL